MVLDMTKSLSKCWTFVGERDLHGYLAEAAVAAYMCDRAMADEGSAETVRWFGGNHKGVDVLDSTRCVDVKKAFVELRTCEGGQKRPCLGFMGSRRGEDESGEPNPQVRDEVTHYALVEVLGGVTITVSESLSVDIDSKGVGYRVFLVPREFVNTRFHPEYTRSGARGKGMNHFVPLEEVLSFKVVESAHMEGGES